MKAALPLVALWLMFAASNACAEVVGSPEPMVITKAPTVVPAGESLAPMPVWWFQSTGTAPAVSVQPVPVAPVPLLPPPSPQVVYRPLIPVTKLPTETYFGRGIFGQPKVYVPGQPVRNFFRYLGP